MSGQVMAGSSPIPKIDTVLPDVNCRSANFHPTIWCDRFLSYDPNPIETWADSDIKDRILELKGGSEEDDCSSSARSILEAGFGRCDPTLGHVLPFRERDLSNFTANSRDGLQNCPHNLESNFDNDLYTVALRFRLLRQQGYHVS